ncbi:MAG: protease complex subunit PrcB family protein [Proteobacteria bacterium]|nr:protease complex subunit PrcB family protein [Pseudomonadota bacterium]
MNRFTSMASGATLLCLAGCTNQSLDVSEVMTYHDCRNLTAGVHKISFEDLAGLRGSQFVDGPPDRTPVETPEDLTLIAISKGDQPTPGYSLTLADPISSSDGRTARITLVWSSPPEDAVLAQVMTHPCLVISVRGAADTLEVSDQMGLIGRLDLPQ